MLFLSAFVSASALQTDLVLIPDGELVIRILGIDRRFVKGIVRESDASIAMSTVVGLPGLVLRRQTCGSRTSWNPDVHSVIEPAPTPTVFGLARGRC